jgi:Secretion system C-terminal sorting domain
MVFSQASNRIFEVDDAGNLKLLAGSDSLDGFGGDGGPATAARFNHPADMAFDPWGNMYVTDADNGVVRMVDTSGIIHPFAGTDTTYGFAGAGGPANAALFMGPVGIVADGAGNVYVADEINCVVWRIDHETKIITIIAGTGTGGFSGDGGPATAAELCAPVGLAFDKYGNLYIADQTNNRIRKVTNAGVPLRARQPVAVAGDAMKVYPNPATSQLTVEGARGCALTLVDAVGQAVWSLREAGMKETIPLTGLAPGVYTLVAMNAETGERVVRMVLLR